MDGCRRRCSFSAMIACAAAGRTQTSERILGAPSLPFQTAVRRRALPTTRRYSASSRGWCAMQTARGCRSSPSACLIARGRSRTLGRSSRRGSSSLRDRRRGSSRAEVRSATGSSRPSSLLMTSSRSRPAGRLQSSRWRRRSACRSRGRTGTSSRTTWWQLDERAVVVGWWVLMCELSRAKTLELGVEIEPR